MVRSADVAVRRERRAEPVAPAPARLQLRQEAPDVGDNRLRRVGRQHQLEMAPCQLLLALEVERARELQPHPQQPRFLDQHGAEGADRLVQQVLPRVVGHTGQLRRPRRREAVEEDRVGLDRIARNQWPQNIQRLYEAASVDQRPCVGDAGRGGRGSLVRCLGLIGRYGGR